MQMDKQMQFDDAAALTVTRASTNIVDLGVERDIGIGYKLGIDLRVGTAFTAGGSATLQVQLQTATDAAFTTPVVLFETAAIPVASLIAGFEPARIPIISPTNRYLRLYYTVATGPMTAGTISANTILEADRQANRSYPSGIPAQT